MLSVANFFLTLLAFESLLCVKAGLYVVHPQQGSVCHGGQPCTVTWLDDGSSPLLTAVGVVNVGLYTGKQQLVQVIQPVDVSQGHSLTFTPKPSAGPNSDAYYIALISNSAKQSNSLPYAAFSSFFRLDKMTGSFDTPDPSATLPIIIPSSILPSGKPTKGDDGVLTTITVGTISPSTSPSHTSKSSSSSPAATGSSSSTPSTRSNSATVLSTTATSPITGPGSTSLAAPSGLTTIVQSSSVSSPSPTSSSTGSTSGAGRIGFLRGAGISAALTSVVVVFLAF